MKKVLIISNALAADGKSRGLLGQSRTLESDFEVEVVQAQSQAGLAPTLMKLDRSQTAAIVIFGGDGTVHRCLPSLAAAAIPIAVFPAGTVNDLALDLGMTSSWHDLKNLLLRGQCVSRRLLEVNGRSFAVYGTLGLGAEASRRMQQSRTLVKAFRQAFPTLQTPLFTAATIFFTNGYNKRLSITVNGSTHHVQTPGIYIANQRRVNRRIDLDWDPEEMPRRFRLVMFKPIGRVSIFSAVARFNRQGHLNAVRSVVDVLDVERAAIESLDRSPIVFVADGEPVIESAKLEISVATEPVSFYRA